MSKCKELFIQYADAAIDYERTHNKHYREIQRSVINTLPYDNCGGVEENKNIICDRMLEKSVDKNDKIAMAATISLFLNCPKTYQL